MARTNATEPSNSEPRDKPTTAHNVSPRLTQLNLTINNC